jgi:hypothetical protein
MLYSNAPPRQDSAKPGTKLIGKNSLHMKRRSEHPDAGSPWQFQQKANNSGGISQVFQAVEMQKNNYNPTQV